MGAERTRSLGRRAGAALLAAAVASVAFPALAQDEAEELAKQLANPISSLISVPFQANYDEGLGPDDEGDKLYLNFQPVAPFRLSADWNVISRTILPIVDQHDVIPGTSQAGIGDVVQSLFFSPAAPTAGGLIWGTGPVLLLPTGSEPELSARKWGIGPTVVVLRQSGHWTYGALANHLWSVAGDDERDDVSSTFLQPFLSHTTATALTLSLSPETTYDWRASQWSVPVNVTAAKLTKLGRRPTSLGGGVRYWAEGPEGGPDDWGLRLFVTLLFPK